MKTHIVSFAALFSLLLSPLLSAAQNSTPVVQEFPFVIENSSLAKHGALDPKKDSKDQYYWGLTADKSGQVYAYFLESEMSGGEGGGQEVPWLDGAQVEGLTVIKDPKINGAIVPGEHIVGFSENGPFICASKRGVLGSLFKGSWDRKETVCELSVIGLAVEKNSYFGKSGLLTRKKMRNRTDSRMKLVLTIRLTPEAP
ncbi:MAG: hypothetical protein K2X47_04005 [Bdellovibrionales bacterium]|nr:hypothetical protein [Bdellovibrionales bacterium]